MSSDYEDIKTALADLYSQPRKPRLHHHAGHGESVPLPSTRGPQPPITPEELQRLLGGFDRFAAAPIVIPVAMIALFILIR